MRRSRPSATARTSGLTTTRELIAGPLLSYASIRWRYASTSSRHVNSRARSTVWIRSTVISSIVTRRRGWPDSRATHRSETTEPARISRGTSALSVQRLDRLVVLVESEMPRTEHFDRLRCAPDRVVRKSHDGESCADREAADDAA